MMKKKRVISLIVAFAMILSLVGNFPAFADSGNTTTITISFDLQDGIKPTELGSFKMGVYVNKVWEKNLDIVDSYIEAGSFSLEVAQSDNDSKEIIYTFDVSDLNEAYEAKVSGSTNNYYTVTISKAKVESEYTHTDHPVCGAKCDGKCVEGTHEGLTWTPLSLALTKEDEKGHCYKLAVGNYYLDKNITLAEDDYIELSGDVNICLNGYKLQGNSLEKPFIQNSDCKLNFTDCSESNSGSVVNDTGDLTDFVRVRWK